MESKNSSISSLSKKKNIGKSKETKNSQDTLRSNSTQVFQKMKSDKNKYERVSKDDLMSESESTPESSSIAYYCKYGSEGKKYTEKKLLQKNLKKLDTVSGGT